jgi:hypothetical protein
MSEYDNVVDVDFEDYDDDGLEDAFEDLDDDMFMGDDDSEDAERRRRRRRRRRRSRRSRSRARGGGYYQRQLKGYATKKELKTALARVGRDVRRNKSGTNANSSRISRLSSSTGKAIKTVRKDVDDTKQMFLLTSLLSGDKKYKVTESGNTTAVPVNTTFTLKDESDSMDKLLPILLMGGLGGSSGSKGGMMDNPLMLILLLDSMK